MGSVSPGKTIWHWKRGKYPVVSIFPFSLQPKPGCSKKTWAGGALLWPTSWQMVPPRLPSVLELGCFSSVFPSHPPTAPSILPPCPLLQGSCCPLALTSEPSPSPCPLGPAREGRHLFSRPRGLFPIHFVHIHGDTKRCPGFLGSCSCTSQATSAKSCSGLSPSGPGRCPSPAGTLLQFFVSSFITRVDHHCQLGLDSQGFSIGSSRQPFKSRRVLKTHKT